MRRAVTVLAAGALLAGGLTWPGAAVARHARRYERKQVEPTAKLGKKKETGLDQSLKANLNRPKKVTLPKGPQLQFEQFRRTVELQVAAKRHEQIDTLTKIVALGPSPKEAPSLLFRLAELYWEEARSYFFQANHLDDLIIKAKGHPDQIAEYKRQQAGFNQKSAYYRGLAVGRYREIIKHYPRYERLDEVLFSLGSNLWEQNKEDAALRVYKVLIRHFKNSEYLPDAYLAFGEHFFNIGKIPVALAAYKRAAKYTQSKVYGFAMYKAAWCYYNLAQWNDALDLFKAVIFYGTIAGGVSGDKKLALVKQARRDYVLTYSQDSPPEDAKKNFQVVGGDQAGHMLHSLADLYYDEGKDREAILVYRILIKDRPLSPESPGYQARIVDAAQRIGNKRYTVQQARLLVRLFHDVEKAGVAKTKKEKKELVDARDFAERTLRTLAVTWHSEAKKTRDDKTFYYAYEMYHDYVTLFPNTKFAYEMHFYFGELLYHLEKYAEAAEQYTDALKIDIARIQGKRRDENGKPEKPGKFLVDSAFNAVLSYEEVAKKFEETEHRSSSDPTKPQKIPAPKQALLDACNRYLKYVPNGDKIVEVTYKAANIYYRYNHFDEAVQRFAMIALEHPTHDLAVYSANLVLDSYNLLKRPDKVNAWARRFYANKQLAKGKFASDLRTVIEESALTMVERIEKTGDHEKAALAYEGFVKEFPHSRHADAALFNASVAWSKARQLDRALALRARIINDYPQSKLVPEAIFSTAKGYESVADFAKAARFYEMYTDAYKRQSGPPPAPRHHRGHRRHRRRHRAPPKATVSAVKYDEGKAQEALYNAAVLREGLGEYGRARADRLEYAAMWPNGKDTPDLVLSIAELDEKAGHPRRAVAQIDTYLQTYAKSDYDKQLLLRLRQAKLLAKLHGRRDRGLATKKYQEILAYYDRLGRKKSKVQDGLLAVATAEYATLGDVGKDYRSEKLVYPWKEGVSPKKLLAIIKTASHVTSQRQVYQIKRAAKRFKRGISVADKAFKKSLQDKSAKLKAVAAKYTHIVKYKQGEPALCALEKIGELYQNFVAVLRNAPQPPYIQEDDQAQMFRDLMSKQALPIEDKAADAYAAAVAKSRELMIYNDCARRSLKALQKLRPDAWPTLVEIQVKPGPLPVRQHGSFLLTAIAKVPQAKKALPKDVASAPPPRAKPKPKPKPAEHAETLPPPGEDDDAPPVASDHSAARSPPPTTTSGSGSGSSSGSGEPDDTGLVP